MLATPARTDTRVNEFQLKLHFGSIGLSLYQLSGAGRLGMKMEKKMCSLTFSLSLTLSFSLSYTYAQICMYTLLAFIRICIYSDKYLSVSLYSSTCLYIYLFINQFMYISISIFISIYQSIKSKRDCFGYQRTIFQEKQLQIRMLHHKSAALKK